MPTETAAAAANLTGITRTKNPDLVDETEAAAILDVAVGTLGVWRSSGRYAIPFIKIGRKVRYSRRALDAWLESRTRSTGATE